MTGTVAERAATGLAMGVQSARRRTRDDDALERRSVRRHGFNRGETAPGPCSAINLRTTLIDRCYEAAVPASGCLRCAST